MMAFANCRACGKQKHVPASKCSFCGASQIVAQCNTQGSGINPLQTMQQPRFFKTGMSSLVKKLRHRFQRANKIRPLECYIQDLKWFGNFNEPEAYCDYYFVDNQHGIVGEISGGMSPLQDTFYLFRIEVMSRFSHDQYEISMLANIAQLHSVPITPVYGIERGSLGKMREMAEGTFQINAPLSAGDMAAEMLRWSRVNGHIDKIVEP